MKNKTLLVILALLATFQVAQGQITIKQYTSATDTFYWKRYEHVKKPSKLKLSKYTVSGSGKLIERFVSLNLEKFPQFAIDSTKPFRIADLKKCLFPMDLNGDDLADIVFSGYSGGESDKTQIFLNKGDHFELVFEDYQYISSLSFQKKKLTEILMADVGCCDAYLYFTRDYPVRMRGDELDFVKGKQTALYQFTERPFQLLNPPIPWKAVYDTTLIRASAANLDDPYNPALETWGNTIAGYTQNIRGVATAIKKDPNGNIWYFVEIIPDVKPRKSIFYEIDKFPTFIQGWVEGSLIRIQP